MAPNTVFSWLILAFTFTELQNQGLDDVHNYAEGGPCRLVDDKGGKQLKVKWKNYEKISRAYADWINDLPLVSHTI